MFVYLVIKSMPNRYTIITAPSDPLLLANVTLRCGMYPTGIVAISRHIVRPGSPGMTILLAS